MRWTTALLAVLTATTQLALFLLAERQLRALGMPGASERGWLRSLWGLLWAAPWMVGALLMILRRTRIAAAVLITAAVLLLAGSLPSIAPALTWPPFAGLTDLSAVVMRFGGLTVWVLAAATAILAWRSGPGGQGRWRDQRTPTNGGYVLLAILAWLPAVFATSAVAPPGAPRRFVETHLTELDGLAAVAGALVPLVLAGVLWVAPRLPRDRAGAVLLTVMVPTLVSETADLYRVSTENHVILTPVGVMGLIGAVGMTIVGLRWLAPVRPRDRVSGAATGRGRRHREPKTPRTARGRG